MEVEPISVGDTSAKVEIKTKAAGPAAPVKPGWKTSEFLSSQTLSTAILLGEFIPSAMWKAIAVAIIQAAYTIGRAITKKR